MTIVFKKCQRKSFRKNSHKSFHRIIRHVLAARVSVDDHSQRIYSSSRITWLIRITYCRRSIRPTRVMTSHRRAQCSNETCHCHSSSASRINIESAMRVPMRLLIDWIHQLRSTHSWPITIPRLNVMNRLSRLRKHMKSARYVNEDRVLIVFNISMVYFPNRRS